MGGSGKIVRKLSTNLFVFPFLVRSYAACCSPSPAGPTLDVAAAWVLRAVGTLALLSLPPLATTDHDKHHQGPVVPSGPTPNSTSAKNGNHRGPAPAYTEDAV